MKGLVTAVATGGVLAGAGYAYADSNADGGAESSPGLLAGNTVHLPVNVPVDVCGNTVNVVGLLSPAAGNSCANAPAAHQDGTPRAASRPGAANGTPHGASGGASGGAAASARGKDSPGLISGNGIQLPIDLPVNVTGNSVSLVGVANPAVGNTSTNASAPAPAGQPAPGAPAKPRPAAAPATAHRPVLAHTGSDGVGFAAPASAALLLGGTVLYRRFRNVRA